MKDVFVRHMCVRVQIAPSPPTLSLFQRPWAGTGSPQLAPTPYCATAGERAEGERLEDPSVAQNHSHSVQKGLNARVASTDEQSMP